MKEKRNLGASSPGTLKVPGVGLTVGSGDLAAALLESGDRENAHKAAERALRYNKDPERLQELTALIQETAKNDRPSED